MNWQDIKTAIDQNDTAKMAEYRASIWKHMEDKAMDVYVHRASIQSLVAATWGDILLKLQADANDVIAKLQHELLSEFCDKHGLTTYTDVAQIQPEDTVAVTWKHKKKTYVSHFRVLQPYGQKWMVTLSMWEHDEIQYNAHERAETINKKNFIVGVRQQTPPIMKKPQKFYIINFNEMELNLTGFETAIEQFLVNLAIEDKAFAEKYYNKPNKSVAECCKYICQEVEKNRKGAKCVACTDEEVFGLAIHYYDEDDIVVEGPKAKVEAVAAPQPVTTTEAETAPAPVETPKPKRARKKTAPVDPDIPDALEIPLF